MDIVRFKGGLGNQMFQYAFMKALEYRGRDVRASLGFYKKHPELMKFVLDCVFRNISLKIDEDEFERIDCEWQQKKRDPSIIEDFINFPETRFFWVENDYEQFHFVEDVFKTNNCVFVGYWQCYKYFSDIRDVLLKDFQFAVGDDEFKKLKADFWSNDMVSIHVRRGDYMKNISLYGGICTDKYYHNSIEYVRTKLGNVKLAFFSDDIEWVKKKLWYDGAIYMDRNCFEQYHDWYDMCLMSISRAVIVANSTFSWWGGWLNSRNDVMVIAPASNWINGYDTTDIIPKHWTRMSIK